jgi:hypothetical protein
MGEGTLADRRSNDEEAPKTAIRQSSIELAGSPRSCRSPPVRHRPPVTQTALTFKCVDSVRDLDLPGMGGPSYSAHASRGA